MQIVSDAFESLQNDLNVSRFYKGIFLNFENLIEKSNVELDIKKWCIQSSLREVRILFNQMIKDFAVRVSLELSIERKIIDVYDRIDSYLDTKKLAANIANIGSKKASYWRYWIV